MERKEMMKKALVLSVCLLVLWGVLGTGATIAWFTDTTPAAKNTFIIGELDLEVSYKNDKVSEYTPVEKETSIFNDEALYEPGYTQVVYLKIENKGDMDFNYKLSVDKISYIDSINVYGSNLHLPNYLRFGVIYGENEVELDRKIAQGYADTEMKELDLNIYSTAPEPLEAGGMHYAALIVYMPEEVGNEANYRGSQPPQVQLGMTAYAQQAGTPMN